MNIKQELQQNNIIAIVMPNTLYMQEYPKLMSKIVSSYNKICYITLTKPYNLLVQNYKEHIKKFFFVDVATKSVISKPKKADNVAYVESQTDFKENRETIDKSVSKQKSEIVLFDNLSNLFVFQKSIEGINYNNFLFIDAVTKAASQKPEGVDNCTFISSASALTELSLTINEVLKNGQIKSILFDSLSTILIYNKSAIACKFIHDIINKIRSHNTATIFTALEWDAKSELLNEMSMFIDRIIGTEKNYRHYYKKINFLEHIKFFKL